MLSTAFLCILLIAGISHAAARTNKKDDSRLNLSYDDEEKGAPKAEDEPRVYFSDESRLLAELLRRYRTYKTLARPCLNSSATIYVHFGISLVQILDFDEKNQMLSTLVWKEYKWKDDILNWDPANYGHVEIIRLPGDKIWKPDIILYNNVGSPDVEQHKDLLLISSNGTIVWIPPVIYKSSCSVDMTNYPFDIQTCTLRFGSWTYDVKRLDPVFLDGREAMKLQGYVPSSEWEIVENIAQKNVLHYPCCETPYADLTFNLTLKRRVTFHMRLILIPTVLLSAMSVSIFWIPPNRPDRTGLGLSLFTSFFLLLILLVNSSPPTPSAKLGQYCCAVILMVSLGLILSVLNINISQTKGELPKIVEIVFIHFLAGLSCRTKTKKVKQNSLLEMTTVNSHNRRENHRYHGSNMNNSEKWHTVAIILDRIFFLGFVLALIFTFIYIFPEPLNLFTL